MGHHGRACRRALLTGLWNETALKVTALAMVEDAYLGALSRGSDDDAKIKGVTIGRAVGAAMLALRQDDGATKDAPYTPSTGFGMTPAFLSGE